MSGFFQDQKQQTGWSGQDPYNEMQQMTAANATVSERMGFVRKVYALFFAGILFSGVGVGVGFSFPSLMIAVIENRWIAFFLLIGAIIGAQAVRLVPVVNLVALFAFTTLIGIFISPLLAIIAVNNPNSIWQAAILTTGIFGGLTTYAFVTKKDFSFLSGMLTVGLIVVILSGILNIFLVSSAFSFGIAVTTLILFSGYVLYDTQQIIHRYPTNEYVAGALDLFLDAFNIFMALLRILNGRRD
ncbi:MAG: Bax inhibitor-1/YccA family protein [Acidobacteria bacterium]|nr:Bax inhibitor-1/YccA family protein [Acidobacteriota bacterium]